MNQVIVIHGGATFSSYDKYITHLQTEKVQLDRLVSVRMWRDDLQHVLEETHQVLLPAMPNKTNAQYREWKIWFDRIAEVAQDDCILVGHSLGAVFLVKYLSENKFPKRIKATVLIAASYDDESIEDLTDFKLTNISDMFRSQAGKVIFFHGYDDHVISPADLEKYKAELPNAEFNILPAPDHFMRPEFPELIKALREV